MNESVTRKEILNFSYNGELDPTIPLVCFNICGDSFFGEFETNGEEVDFEEMSVVVPREWLLQTMKEEGIENPLEYLKDEYTSYDSKEWYDKADMENKIVSITF